MGGDSVTGSDDTLSLGVTGSASNFSTAGVASYAQALAEATALINGGSRDIVVRTVLGSPGGLEDGTYAFVDGSGQNTITNAIRFNGLTGALDPTDFV
ncbi:MAG: hypothetical protein V4597_14845 [Pseudomonadota bacterium]